MGREFKHLTFSSLKSEASGRVRTGIAAVHGNVDSWDDRSHPGAFAKSIAEASRRVKHLWNHNSGHPPIASIVELSEIGPGEMPAEILAQYPAGTITGGLKVVREYYDNDLASWVLEGIDRGDITEMSYAFDVVKCDWTDEDLPTGGTRRVRELRELKLYDTSDVNWGMNPATVASFKNRFAAELQPLGVLLNQFHLHLEEIKAGRRNSDSDLALIQQVHDISIGLGGTCPAPAEETDSEKAEAAANGTSLERGRFELQRRRAALLGLTQ